MAPYLAILGLLLIAALLLFAKQSVNEEDVWSIGIFAGATPLSIGPHPRIARQPVLRAEDVSDVPAAFVADPFLLRDGDKWHLFFEVLNRSTQRGELACASSDDGLQWRYDRIVLREPFHLSYPCVFRSGGDYYMIPESGEAQSVRLYRAVAFPHRWEFVQELLHGHYLDASIVQYAGRWWLFSLRNERELVLHFAAALTGPWIEHPASPIAQSKDVARPGGRILVDGERLLRFSQDGTGTYGRCLHAFEVTTLTTDDYAERRVASNSPVGASGAGWNAHGMHHIDAVVLDDGSWIAAVDGKFIRRRFLWRKGARALVDWLTSFRRRTVADTASN